MIAPLSGRLTLLRSLVDVCATLIYAKNWISSLTLLAMAAVVECGTASTPTGVPSAPYNLTISAIRGTWVRISWLVAAQTDYISHFDVTVTSDVSGLGVYEVVFGVDGRLRHCILSGLADYSVYAVYMVAVDHVGTKSNRSNTVSFTTATDVFYESSFRQTTLQPGEFILLICVIVAWFIAVVIFLRRWDSIRILQPVEPRYRHSPKNLENVIVVKKPQDSVIYKNYSRKLSVTLLEREKRRLQRMNTMPAIPLHETIMLEDM